MKDELQKKQNRERFLHLLLSDDIENSVVLSFVLATTFSDSLHVPLALEKDADYLQNNSLPTEVKGVYCRNLTLTQMVNGTLAYCETLYQDNKTECMLLGKKTPVRVEQVSDAYYKAIKKYFSGH